MKLLIIHHSLSPYCISFSTHPPIRFLVDGIYKHISGDLPIALSMVSYSQMEVFRTLAEPVLARCSRETRKPRETLLSLNIAARHDYFYAISPTMVFICSDKNVGFLGSFRFEWIKSLRLLSLLYENNTDSVWLLLHPFSIPNPPNLLKDAFSLVDH